MTETLIISSDGDHNQDNLNSNNNSGTKLTKKQLSVRNFSYFGLITCLASIVLAFVFKDYLIYLLNYLERKSTTNIVEFHIILLLLFICVSLPILWGYIVCVLICAYVYSFVYGFMLVVLYSTIGMTCSFFICRYMFYECAHQRVQSIPYLKAISAVIESNDKGIQIIFLSRLMPIPFGLANTVFAVTDVRLRNYLLSSVVGLIPSHLILCYLGSTLKSMTDVLINDNTAKTAYLVFIVQLIIAVLVMYYILKASRNEFNKHLDENNKMKMTANGSIISSSFSNLLNTGVKCPYCKSTGSNIDCENCQLLSLNIQS